MPLLMTDLSYLLTAGRLPEAAVLAAGGAQPGAGALPDPEEALRQGTQGEWG